MVGCRDHLDDQLCFLPDAVPEMEAEILMMIDI
jgi:hypothetical protein